MHCLIREYECVSSTNDEVKRALEAGEPEGLAVRSFEQTGGYGRQGRSWVSPVGGMYESFLLRPSEHGVDGDQIATLSLVASLAVRRALIGLLPADSEPILIKWPNDVVCSSDMPDDTGETIGIRKLSGISLEAYAGAVCAGIGVNVFPPASTVELEAKNKPLYLSQLGYHASLGHALSLGTPASARAADPAFRKAITAVGDAVVRELEQAYELWCDQGFIPFLNEYRDNNVLLGVSVQLVNRNGACVAQGTCVDIDGEGRLVVSCTDGRTQAFSSGEVHLQSVFVG